MKVHRKGNARDVLESIVHVDNTSPNKQCILCCYVTFTTLELLVIYFTHTWKALVWESQLAFKLGVILKALTQCFVLLGKPL